MSAGSLPKVVDREPVVLVVQHTEGEHLARLDGWLRAAGVRPQVLRPYAGDRLPRRLAHEGLIVLGGPQQAYDDASAGWLAGTKDLLRTAVAAGVPTLGVCLGAQLLAVAGGGRVAPGSHGPEVGARLVAKRDIAARDPLFGPLPLSPVVVQWHEDEIVELPAGAVLLAAGTTYQHQAFRLGAAGYGLQFHIETDEPMVKRWTEETRPTMAAAGIDVDRELAGVAAVDEELAGVWSAFAARFAALVRGR